MQARYFHITYCAFLLAWTLAGGQTVYHYIQPDFDCTGGELHIDGNGFVRMTGMGVNESLFGFAGVYQTTFNKFGDLLLTERLDGIFGEVGNDFTTLPLADGSFFVLASVMGCDVGVPSVLVYYDAFGEFVWGTEVDGVYTGATLSMVRDSIIAVSGNALRHFNMQGLPIDTIDALPYDNQMSLHSGFLASRGNVFYVLDAQLSITDSISISSYVMGFDTISGHGYAVLSDSLSTFDSSLQILRTVLVEGNYRNVIHTGETVLLFNSGNQVLRLDSNLTTDSVYVLPFNGQIKDVLHFENSIFISGVHTNEYNRGMFLIRTQTDAFLEAPAPDIEFLDIHFEDTIRYGRASGGWPFSTYQIDYGPVYVTLANRGNTSLTSTHVRFDQLQCPGICQGHYQFNWRLDSLNLAPNDTVTLFLTDLDLNCAYFSPYDFCLWTTGPNDQPDADVSNDYLCADIDIVISSLEDPVAQNNAVTINPNPASSEVTITYANQSFDHNATVTIYNSHGHLIDKISLNEHETTIPVNGYSPGMYYFALQTENTHPMVRKVVVTH